MTDPTLAERLGIQTQQAAFSAALLGEDPLGMIVRAHIYIEHELNAFIRKRLSPPEALDAIELDYAGRVKLSLALGLPSEFEGSLGFIGTLRNRFAHQLDATITKQDANNFAQALGPVNAIAEKAYNATQSKMSSDGTARALREREPMDRVIFYFVTLWGGMAAAVVQATAST